MEKVKREKTKEDLILASVYSSGFNIYQCINRLKKQLGFAKDFKFPEEVIIKVCMQYAKDRKQVRNQWSWFIKVFAQESEKYYAEENIRVNDASKGLSMCQKVRDLVNGITNNRVKEVEKEGYEDKSSIQI